MNSKAVRTVLACALWLLVLHWIFPAVVLAHRVTVFAWVEGDTVVVTGKFSGGKKVKGGAVLVKDLSGHLLLEGRTDDNGEFTFTPPQKTGLKIVLYAGAGHRGEWVLEAAEWTGAETASAKPEEVLPAREPSAPSVHVSSGQTGTGLSEAVLRTIVEEALERRLAPIERRLNQSLTRDEGPSLTDILGGIGYILGLVGLGAYIHSRRKTGDTA